MRQRLSYQQASIKITQKSQFSIFCQCTKTEYYKFVQQVIISNNLFLTKQQYLQKSSELSLHNTVNTFNKLQL